MRVSFSCAFVHFSMQMANAIAATKSETSDAFFMQRLLCTAFYELRHNTL
jgi:hypothetical protein